jgi:hypothetical protein
MPKTTKASGIARTPAIADRRGDRRSARTRTSADVMLAKRSTWAFAASVALAASGAHAQDNAVFPGRKGGQDTFGHYSVVADWSCRATPGGLTAPRRACSP